MVNRLAKAYLYALVPVFSLSIEDTYWLKRLVGRLEKQPKQQPELRRKP